MQILKLLDQLEKLEVRLSELYKRFSGTFRDDAEASIFFYQMGVDEEAHADLVRFARRLVRADQTQFREVDADAGEIEKLLSNVDILLKSAESLTMEKALEASMEIERNSAEDHHVTSAVFSNAQVAGLLQSLSSFDHRHFVAFEEFAGKRSVALKTGRSVKGPEPQQRPEDGQAAPPRSFDVSQEIIDRIDYLYAWHKSMGYYKLLGVRDYATEVQIRQAYHRIAKEFHPDLHMDFPEDLRQKLTAIFSHINIAYSTLTDPQKKKEYDKTSVSHRF